MSLELPAWVALLVSGLTLGLSAIVSCHVVLHKRDSRAAIGWAGLVWLAPIVGSILYLTLGINRIRRRAITLRAFTGHLGDPGSGDEDARLVRHHLGPNSASFRSLAALIGRVSDRRLLPGNVFLPLVGGAEAYPPMLEAIAGAKRSILLATYIFDRGLSGARFVQALGEAVARGVQVAVLVDGMGARTSRPTIVGDLRRVGVRCELFLPARHPLLLRYSNLRNHRKLLVVDGVRAFTGGMNLREGNLAPPSDPGAIGDLHFDVQGPVVRQLREVFEQDWLFTTSESLEAHGLEDRPDSVGTVPARALHDGPDESLDRLRYTLLAAIGGARHSIRIRTPYFLPDSALITALNVAALRGVRVEVLIPSQCNLPLVQWACDATLWQVLQFGCHVHACPPPFDHSKSLVVDDTWCLIGSTNWDPRSLRLNFELCVECYDPGLSGRLNQEFDRLLARSPARTLAEMDARRLPRRIRDGFARLLTPYL